ncbi:MAG TPA: hypothetical protein VKB49_25045, partial [Candidatus Sulfotelmatobacter sp.]|nr:hypothetical protein [Candidatus Sulfotelmatobacter sp.]
MDDHAAWSVRGCWHIALLCALMASVTVSSSLAQTPGVTDNSVLIGSCSALDGPAHFLGRQTVLGASA